METPLRALIVEDSAFDAQMLVAMLKKGGYAPSVRRVETPDQMRQALQEARWDLVLADYNLPQFSAPAALDILHETGLDIPFIIVSGAIGESTAVESMRAGAHDYLMKGNLARLVPAVSRELREAENRAGRRRAQEALAESELRYRLLWETATDAILLVDPRGVIHFANPATEAVFGYTPDELIGQDIAILQPERLRAGHREAVENYLKTGRKTINWRATETVARRKGGREIAVEVAFSDMEFMGKHWFVGFIRDITERQRTEQELLDNQEQFRVAREIQQHLFPKEPPQVRGFDIAGTSEPAEATGGDYFDYLPMLNDRVGLVIGDVAGHGVGPALLMAETRAYLRILAKNREDVGEILSKTNVVLSDDVGYERFVTLLLAQIDPMTRTLTYANAGHATGFILSPDGAIKAQLKRTGIALGLKVDSTYAASPAITLHLGDVILLLTDGFEEAVSAQEELFGTERALDIVRSHLSRSATQIVEALYEGVRAFVSGQPQADDLTAIVAKVTE